MKYLPPSPQDTLFGDELMGRLMQQIVTMEPGDRLPSEREQALRMNVSRTALRDRIGRLESLGVLERRDRAGTFVIGLRPETVSEVLTLGLMGSKMSFDSLVPVRVALERQAAIEATRRVDHVNLAYMAVAVDRMEASNDSSELHAADMAFHRALFNASGSPGLVFFAQVLSSVLSSTMRHLALDQDRVRMRVLHRVIYDAVRSGDQDAVVTAVDEHFAWLDELMHTAG
jgi:GntR family transcriptional repressor for pyruvate dehydrogenase complex